MRTAFKNARIYRTQTRRFELGTLTAENGVIRAIGDDSPADETIDCQGAYMIPGMVDIHTHGRDGLAATGAVCDGMLELSRAYAKAGTTAFLPTLMSAPLDILESSIDHIAAAKRAQADKSDGAHILGVHLEGRYISDKRKGAHESRYLAPLDPDEMAALIKRSRIGITDCDRFHMICAPELSGSEAFVKRACSLGATVSIGHSDATYEDCKNSITWGMRSFTHLYNAMSPLGHRELGCVGAALTTDAYTELICDGVHVAPEIVRLTYYQKSADRLALITDSAPCAGLPDGKYAKNGAEVIVEKDAAWLPDGTLTGSVISLFEALLNFKNYCSISLEEAIPYATINPARLIGAEDIVGSLDVGKFADFLLLDTYKETIKRVYINGAPI